MLFNRKCDESKEELGCSFSCGVTEGDDFLAGKKGAKDDCGKSVLTRTSASRRRVALVKAPPSAIIKLFLKFKCKFISSSLSS